MKKLLSGIAAFALVLAVAGTSFAQGRMGGCGDCSQNTASTDQFRKFQQDTLDLRQEMMNKRFDLQRENLKATPDAAKVTALKAEISAIQEKISSIRVASGLPDKGKRDGECFKMKKGGCNKQNGSAPCNSPCGQ